MFEVLPPLYGIRSHCESVDKRGYITLLVKAYFTGAYFGLSRPFYMKGDIKVQPSSAFIFVDAEGRLCLIDPVVGLTISNGFNKPYPVLASSIGAYILTGGITLTDKPFDYTNLDLNKTPLQNKILILA